MTSYTTKLLQPVIRLYRDIRFNWFKLMWRCNYAGYMMQITRCEFKDAWEKANAAFELYGTAQPYMLPTDVAKRQLQMWGKHER